MSVEPTASSQIFQGIKTGAGLLCVQALPVIALNRTSVIACYYNLPMIPAAKMILEGAADGVKRPSMLHFFKGGWGHFLKEVPRVGYKSAGLVMKPQLDDRYGKLRADLIFASALSAAEMVINPTDTIRTMWQAGKRLRDVKYKVSHLYSGSLVNGGRQFAIWAGFPLSERVWSSVIERATPLDPYSIPGIVAKAPFQALQLTAPIWVFERVKNELQYNSELGGSKTSRYIRAFQHITATQGYKGFIRGFSSKAGSNALLVIGADYLLYQGKSEASKSDSWD